MNAGAILTLGLGQPGSAARVVTLGYGQLGEIDPNPNTGGYFHLFNPAYRRRRREEIPEKIGEIIEQLAQPIRAQRTQHDQHLELALRLRLKQARLEYKDLYLTYLAAESACLRRKRNEEAFFAILH